MSFNSKIEYFFIRNLFEQMLALKSIPKKEFLHGKFVELLIKNNQITEAIESFNKLDSMSCKFNYFYWVERVRIS
jgi:hypothetical protein